MMLVQKISNKIHKKILRAATQLFMTLHQMKSAALIYDLYEIFTLSLILQYSYNFITRINKIV